MLSCQNEKNLTLRWLQRGSIITQGSTIKDFKGRERFIVINNPEYRQYELQILETAKEDIGLYVCQTQLDSDIPETSVILKLAGNII